MRAQRAVMCARSRDPATGCRMSLVFVTAIVALTYLLVPMESHRLSRAAIVVLALLPALIVVFGYFAMWWRRRRFRFGTRALLVSMTLLGLAMAVIGHRATRATQHKLRVTSLQRWGARLEYDIVTSFAELPREVRARTNRSQITRWFWTARGRAYPDWVRKVLGDDAFGSVRSIDLSRSAISDTHLNCLADFPDIVKLDLSHTAISGECLAYLRGTKLETLQLSGTEVDDDALRHLEAVTSLTRLYLDDTHVTDEGLRHLRGLDRLETLFLSGTGVTDEGIRLLQGLTRLWNVSLGRTTITDRGLARLTALPKLNYLDVTLTDVTREGLLTVNRSRPGIWVQQDYQDFEAREARSPGTSVALGGGIAAVGHDYENQVHVFDASAEKLLYVLWPDRKTGNPPELIRSGSPYFGSSVDTDGRRIVVGAPSHAVRGAQHCGAVYVFDVTSGKRVRRLCPPRAEEHLGFGCDVAVDNGWALIGARGSERGGGRRGRVFVFDLRTGTQPRELKSAHETGPFGTSLALDGELAAVGSAGRYMPGRVEVFKVTTGDLVRTLTPVPAKHGELRGFGAGVAIDGDMIAVAGGRPLDPARGRDAALLGIGTVEVFNVKTGEHIFQFHFTSRNPHGSLRTSVAISGDVLVVGDDRSYEGTGSVHVFDLTHGRLRVKLVGKHKGEEFGHDVAIRGPHMLIGAPGREVKDGRPLWLKVSEL